MTLRHALRRACWLFIIAHDCRKKMSDYPMIKEVIDLLKFSDFLKQLKLCNEDQPFLWNSEWLCWKASRRNYHKGCSRDGIVMHKSITLHSSCTHRLEFLSQNVASNSVTYVLPDSQWKEWALGPTIRTSLCNASWWLQTANAELWHKGQNRVIYVQRTTTWRCALTSWRNL